MNDHYEILGVPPDADPEQLKAAFLGKVAECHPDLHRNDRDAPRRFKLLTDAYDLLTNPKRRAAYNRERGYPPPPGPTREIDITLTDLQAHLGRNVDSDSGVEAAYWYDVRCRGCDGLGKCYYPCHRCDATGTILGSDAPWGRRPLRVPCPLCHGGKYEVEDPCGDCKGSGHDKAKYLFMVDIRPGLWEGSTLSASDRVLGDVQILVHVKDAKPKPRHDPPHYGLGGSNSR